MWRSKPACACPCACKRSTNRHWAKSCHEFRYYESLVPEGESKPEGEFDPALGVSVPDEA